MNNYYSFNTIHVIHKIFIRAVILKVQNYFIKVKEVWSLYQNYKKKITFYKFDCNE